MYLATGIKISLELLLLSVWLVFYQLAISVFQYVFTLIVLPVNRKYYLKIMNNFACVHLSYQYDLKQQSKCITNTFSNKLHQLPLICY